MEEMIDEKIRHHQGDVLQTMEEMIDDRMQTVKAWTDNGEDDRVSLN